ncbi:MAG: DUF2061 domain-containing protein [Phaeodactylibacter sp.]|nr:DUF2061 domain-containing protein [Phaeodactylibacter sp.]MCB9290839.1 DUF2061 domain-containing protein [Lewinellaceae bacterium]
MEKESKLRSILKAITWRLIATGTTFTLAYFIFSGTGCEDVLQKSTIVAGLELVIKLMIYYLHERAWQMVPRGTVRQIFRRSRKENVGLGK